MSPSLLRGVVAILAIATALIHFSLLFPDPIFILNGLGYLGLTFAYLTNIPFGIARRRLVHYLFAGYVITTILAWIAIGERNTLGYLDKAIEVLLLAALMLSLRQERGQ
ncbi:MAG: hypothetical protein U0556_08650 [Dehalococcoidia bacterium]